MQIGQYLIEKLKEKGVTHIFGVPGDYVLGFYKLLEESSIDIINTCDEQGAGFAADAYARVKGLGAVCITYGVGGFKIVNTTAEAYAEKSPVLVISGGPGVAEKNSKRMLHHTVNSSESQHRIFSEITVEQAVLNDTDTALTDIDRVFAAIEHEKRPGYIEIPRDMVFEEARTSVFQQAKEITATESAYKECLSDIVDRIQKAKKPVIVAGVELHRYGCNDFFLECVDKWNIPVCATLLAKSVIPETDDLYMGIYGGGACKDDVREYVETSDCVIMMGTFLTDINLGIFTSNIDQKSLVYVDHTQVSVGYHKYENIGIERLLKGLSEAKIAKRTAPKNYPKFNVPSGFKPKKGKTLSIDALFQCLNTRLNDKHVVVADVGDAMFGAMDLCIKGGCEFLSPAYYTSLGFAVPGSVGVKAALPDARPIVIVGDGAFMMTGLEIATIARYNMNPIIILLNNGGYGTERPMVDGAFNDIHDSHYSKLTEFIGTGDSYKVDTEDAFEKALDKALKKASGLHFIEAGIERGDYSNVLKLLTANLAKQISTD